MKKRINGRTYDTATAFIIGRPVVNPVCQNKEDPQYWSAKLYITPKKGHIFLYGIGGSMSIFGEQPPRKLWMPGERIIAITREQGVRWAAKYLPDIPIGNYLK